MAISSRHILRILGFAAAFGVSPAQALDPFEIQVYDGTFDEPSAPALELHANRFMTGHRRGSGPELPLHGVTHLTLEPSYGVRDGLEVGAYFQTALQENGEYDFAGVKLRAKLIPYTSAHVRLGVNLELSVLPRRYDRDRLGSELRPIAAWYTERWLVATNPILSTSLTGSALAEGPSFAPSLKVSFAPEPIVAVGFEAYTDFGPLSGFVPWREQENYLFGVLDLVAYENIELNLGFGGGVTEASKGFIIKLIAGYSFGPLSTAGRLPPPQPALPRLAMKVEAGRIPKRADATR